MAKKVKRAKAQRLVHLHNHTEFSFLDSVITVKGLGRTLRKKGVRAYAITDHGNMNGVFRFVKEMKDHGIKPIVGIEFYHVADRHKRGLTEEQKKKITGGAKGASARQVLREAEKEIGVRVRNHVVVLAKNNRGFRKMVRAQEIAYKEGFYYMPRIDDEVLASLAPDVVVLTACLGGVPGRLLRAGRQADALKWLLAMRGTFGDDLYVEIQPNDMEEQATLNPELANLALEADCGIVATNDVHYIERDAWETHDVLLALRESQRGKKVLVSDEERFRYSTHELYLKTRAEMEQSFEKWHPTLLPNVWQVALDNTLKIADKIDPDVLEYHKGILPVVKVEKKYKREPDKKLWALVKRGWIWRKIKQKAKGKTGEIDWIDGKDPVTKPLYEVYVERVKYEMEEIIRLGFSKYFLLIYELIWWARRNGIRPGPGRGSVAGSMVAYLLGITAVDSVKWGCPFSRFISPDRIDYPDIDMDFPTIDRARIKQHLIEKYGQDRVASICNYATMKGKMVLKDVARVFAVPYGETDSVAAHIITRASGDARGSFCLEDTFREFRECRAYYKRYPDVVRHAMALEGNVRQLGVNAAGMVVADRALRKVIPVQYQRIRNNKGGNIGEYITSWDKREIEDIGLLKLDVLGIDGLTYIQRTIDLIAERHDYQIEPEDWEDFDDPKIWREFQEGNTELVWQMNTQGAIRVLKKLKPDNFEHLIAATSLIRPGPLYAGITADYIKRRHGGKVKSVHPMLDSILSKTYGLCIYQEGATQIVHDMAGFTWAQADAVRKCISKKMGKEYMQRHKDLFFKGAGERGVEERTANRVWDAIGQFGQYAFNRAHACSYSLLSYWTMWFKVYYPLEFMTAALEAEGDADKRRKYIYEAKRLGLDIAPPDVNVSGATFTIDDRTPNTIRVGFADIKYVGGKTVENIVDNAPYKDLRDFLDRSKANKRVIEAFLRVGALDGLVENPKQIEENLEAVLKYRKRKGKGKEKYWNELELTDCKPYTRKEREQYLMEYLALPPRVHPSVRMMQWLTRKVKHLKVHWIRDFNKVFESDFATTHRAFVGVCTRVQYQNIATKLSADERKKLKEELGAFADKMEGTERRVKLNLEDATDFLMAMSTPKQYAIMDENKVKQGMIFAAIGRSVGDYRVTTSLLVNLTDMFERLAEGHEFPPGTPEHFLLNDPFEDYRELLENQTRLKPLTGRRGKQRTAVCVVDAHERKTRKGGVMLIVTVLDWQGNMRDLVLWPDDYRRYGEPFKPGAMLAVHVSVKSGNGKSKRYIADLESGSAKRRVMDLEKYFG